MKMRTETIPSIHTRVKKIACSAIALAVLAVSVSIVSLVFHFVPLRKKPTAAEIYSQSLYNVVEVKAESDDVGESFGTGEIVSSDGRIVTNAHVVTYSRLGSVNEFERYYIRFAFEDEYRAVKLEKYDTEADLAVLYFEEPTDVASKPIKLGGRPLASGDKVYAIGNASNYGIGIFEGIVSIPLVHVELDGVTRTVIQCDITIAAGNSGGALVNDDGEFIGMTTFRTKDTSGNVIYGIVYCIPAETILDYADKKS